MQPPRLVLTTAALVLLACAPAAAACGARSAQVSAPAAIVPAALASRYPDGFTATATVGIGASGNVETVAVPSDDTGSAAFRAAVVSWARRGTYETKCNAPHDSVVLDDVHFFPTSSGVVGRPPIVGGINFNEFSYVDTARNNKLIRFHSGVYEDPQGDLPSTIQIDEVFAGRLGGTQVAIVVQRGEGPGGYDAWATAYSVSGNSTRRLASLGEYTFFTTGEGPHPKEWFAFRFAGSKLYADVWQYASRCNPRADWRATTYTIAGGQLATVDVLRHHRSRTPVPGPNASDRSTCSYASHDKR